MSEDREEQVDRSGEEMPASEIDGAFVPVPRSDLTAVVLDEEAVVLVEGEPQAHYLDRMATLVWNTFDGSSTLEELATDFADVFEADIDVVREDIVALAQGIGRAGLLVGIAYEPPPDPSFAWPTGVAIGEPVPPFELPGVDGRAVALADLRGRDVLLVNWSPRCGFCSMIAPELAELQPELQARGVELVFITLGDAEENRPMLEGQGLRPTLLMTGDDPPDVFAGLGTPSAYLLDAEGRAASELTVGADRVPGLARSAAGR